MRVRPMSRRAPAEGILLGLDIGVIVVDPHYDIIRINTAARRVLGIHGTAFDQDFVHLADALPSTQIRNAIESALKGKASTAIYQVESADVAEDAPRHVQATVRPYRTAGNAVSGAVIELADVSRSERDRAAHARTRQRLEKAAAVNERLLRANDELTALIADLRRSNSAMLRSSEDAQAGREEVETLNEEFQATNEELETLNEELTATVEELRIANEDLAARTEELRVKAVAIEEQKRETEEEQHRLRSILASIGDAVVAVDHEGKTVATNVVYDRLFGGPPEEIVLEDVTGVPFREEDRPQRRAARGERFRVEFAVNDLDGKRRWFEAVAEPLTAEDRTWGGVVSIRDVSERTMRLSLERLMAAAGHELKTPTAAIHNYLQLVERRLASGDTAEAATYAARAASQARRLSDLVERLFDVSRIQTGQLEIVVEPVDLVAIVRAATDISAVLANAPTIKLTAKPASLIVRGDAGRLEQVFLNLLANAVEHAGGSGGIDVAVRRSGGFAVVDVRDHGDGIAAEDLSIVFEAYTRLRHPQRATGLGLGLFVSREIVAAHGGSITATSRIGDGTTISVRLPAAPAATASNGRKAPAAGKAATARAATRTAPGPVRGQAQETQARGAVVVIRLAIVEDHPALADGLATLIRGSSDVEVVGTAPDVAKATALIEREQPDVVLCDIRLADDGDDGFTLVRRFAPRPAFIMLTVASYPSYHARAVDLGAMGYLSKMASVDQILVAIRSVAAGGTAYPSDTRRSANEALRLPTPRELEILALVAEGLSNVEIAERLSLRVKTVESQLRRLFDRYDVTSRTALARVAQRQGWIDDTR